MVHPLASKLLSLKETLQGAFLTIEKYVTEMERGGFPDSELYRQEALVYLEFQMMAAFQQGKRLDSILLDFRVTSILKQNAPAVISTTGTYKPQSSAKAAVSTPPADVARLNPAQFDPLSVMDLNVDIVANIMWLKGQHNRGYCEACLCEFPGSFGAFRDHVLSDHRLLAASSSRPENAETVDRLVMQYATGSRSGLYLCGQHGTTFPNRDMMLHHLASEHEQVFYFLLACHLYGTKDFGFCLFPECTSKARWAVQRYPHHLFDAHLKQYVEMEMVQEQKNRFPTSYGNSEITSSKVCPREGCGFAQFQDQLLSHYAYDHRVVQQVFKNFADVNFWDTNKLHSLGFFVEPPPPPTSSSSTALVACPRCGLAVQSLMICLHLDECADHGRLAHYIRQELKVSHIDLREWYACPYTNCRDAPMPFCLLFNHCISRHNLSDLSPELFRQYRRLIRGQPAIGTGSGQNMCRTNTGSAAVTAALPARVTPTQRAQMATSSTSAAGNRSLGHIKDLVKNVLKERAGGGEGAPVIQVMNPIYSIPAERPQKPCDVIDRQACPLTSSDGSPCPKVFQINIRHEVNSFFMHLFVHFQVENENLAQDSIDKIERTGKCSSVPVDPYAQRPCCLSYCREKLPGIEGLRKHIMIIHIMELVVMRLMELSLLPLLEKLCANQTKYIKAFVTRYRDALSKGLILQPVPPPRPSSPVEFEIQIQNCFSVRVDDNSAMNGQGEENTGTAAHNLHRSGGGGVVEATMGGAASASSSDSRGNSGPKRSIGAVEAGGQRVEPPPSEDEDVEIVAAVAAASGGRSAAAGAPVPAAAKSPGIVFVPPRNGENYMTITGSFRIVCLF